MIRAFLHSANELHPSTDGETVAFDPEANLYNTYMLAGTAGSYVLPSEHSTQTPYQKALFRVCTATMVMLEKPSAAAVAVW